MRKKGNDYDDNAVKGKCLKNPNLNQDYDLKLL
jgi:hypothetical protein